MRSISGPDGLKARKDSGLEANDGVEYIGGIPKDIFYKKIPYKEDQLVARSGQIFRVSFEENLIKILPAELGNIPDQYLFLAWIDKGALVFSAFTKNKDGVRHPDMYAKELLIEALAFFERNRGIQIKIIRGRWWPPDKHNMGVNYESFLAFLGGNTNQGKDRLIDAARETWTGRTAMELGFVNIDGEKIKIIKYKDGVIDHIEVEFSK